MIPRSNAGREVLFEGPFGFGCDVVSKGWLRLAHRRVDEARSEPHRPFHPSDRAEPVAPGEIVPADIELLPSATFFRRGDVLRLDVQGQWFWSRQRVKVAHIEHTRCVEDEGRSTPVLQEAIEGRLNLGRLRKVHAGSGAARLGA
jgi:predicted acyl esterase